MDDRGFLSEITKNINQSLKYVQLYVGKVVEILDNSQINVTIEALNLVTNDTACPCTILGSTSITNYKIDDIVIVGFLNGKAIGSGVVFGIANNFQDMKATSFVENSIDTIYEDRNNNIQITFDNQKKELKFFAKSGIKIILENGDGNKIELLSSSVKINGENHEVLL